MARAPVGIVSGSGITLEDLVDEVCAVRRFEDFPDLASPPTPGHDHRFIQGQCGSYPVVLQCGRLHFYDGLEYASVVRTVDVLSELGVRDVVFTNAAGGLRPEIVPGDLVAIEQIRTCRYHGWPSTPGTLLTDFLVPGCDGVGTYQWVHGPCYETQAEIAAIQRLGVDAVGMSTAPELERCHALGMRAAVIACITNSCCRPQRLTHEHVIGTAGLASDRLAAAIRRALPEIVST